MPCDFRSSRLSRLFFTSCTTPQRDVASDKLSTFHLHIDISEFCTVGHPPFEGAVPILAYGESEDFRKSQKPRNGPRFPKQRVGPFLPGSSEVRHEPSGVSG